MTGWGSNPGKLASKSKETTFDNRRLLHFWQNEGYYSLQVTAVLQTQRYSEIQGGSGVWHTKLKLFSLVFFYHFKLQNYNVCKTKASVQTNNTRMFHGVFYTSILLCRMKYMLESRLPRETSIISYMQMISPLCQKVRGTKEPLDESERGELKNWLKTQHSEN